MLTQGNQMFCILHQILQPTFYHRMLTKLHMLQHVHLQFTKNSISIFSSQTKTTPVSSPSATTISLIDIQNAQPSGSHPKCVLHPKCLQNTTTIRITSNAYTRKSNVLHFASTFCHRITPLQPSGSSSILLPGDNCSTSGSPCICTRRITTES